MNWMGLREPALQLSKRFDPVICISTRGKTFAYARHGNRKESVTDIEHTNYYSEAD
jgi:hypothetical protein